MFNLLNACLPLLSPFAYLYRRAYQMNYQILTDEELANTTSGEAITLTAVMAILATAIISVVVYRLFMSKKGTTTVPGGWKFTWN